MTPLALPKGCVGKMWEYHNRGNVGFLHYHDEIELNLVLQGTARCLVGGAGARTYSLNSGTLMWLPSRKEHLLSEKSPDLHMWIALVRPAALGVRELAGAAESLCRRVPLRTLTRLAGLFHDVSRSPEPMAMFNAGLVYAVLKAWEAHRRGQDGLADAALHPSVQKAIALMQHDRADDSIPQLANRVGLSPSRFVEVFKRDTGMTPVEFRNRQRIERFLHLYGNGETRTMLAAAYDAGFGSYPQFFRVFEHVMGCSPGEYRRAITGKHSEFRVQNSD